MLGAIGLVYLIVVILVCLLVVPMVILILFALPLAVFGCFVSLAVIGHATSIITGLAVSLQARALPVALIAVDMWIAYSVGSGLCQMIGTATSAFLRHRGLGHGEPRVDWLMLGGSLVGVHLGTDTLRALSRAVRAKRQVRVLAIGSSSTAGVGASSPTATYIAKLETSLEGSLQGMDFDVVGKGSRAERLPLPTDVGAAIAS